MNSPFRLPRRNPKPKPAPKHAAPPIVRMPIPGGPTGDMHFTVPAEPRETPAARPVSGWSVPAAFPPAEDPEVTEAAETLRGILAGAIPEPPATEVAPEPPAPHEMTTLQRVADRLRALPVTPGAHLRCITPGDDPNPYDQLAGFPVFAGTALASDGRPAAGLYLGNEDKDGRIVLDVFDPAWLDELIDAGVRARRALDAALAGLADGGEDEAAEGGEAA